MVPLLDRLLSHPLARQRGRFVRLTLVTVAVAVVGLLLVWGLLSDTRFSGGGEASPGIRVSEARLLELGPLTVDAPPPASEGVAVELPHRLAAGPARHVNYRVMLDAGQVSAPAGLLAVCVPRWSAGATVWLNGQLLRRSAPGTAGLMDMHRPELVALPPGLAAGPHTLDIRLRAVPGVVTGLSPLWFGDSATLREGCQALQAFQRDSAVGNAYIMVFMGLVALAVGALKRDSMAFYFALLSATWCAHYLFVLGDWTAMDESTWVTIFYATRPLAALPLALFVLSYTGSTQRSEMLGITALYVAAYAVFAGLSVENMLLWTACFGFILVCVLTVLFVRVVLFGVRHAALSVVLFCVALVLAISFNLIDVARALGWLSWSDRTLSYLTVPSLALGMGVLMLERLARYMGAEERAAIALREEVVRQRAKMAGDYLKLREQAEKIAVLEERKRIVRDMHDGLGSQLVSASALLRSSPETPVPLKGVIDSALLELRSVLDVLSASPDPDDPDDDPVSLLLAKLRHRLTPVFRAQGIDIAWQTEPLPPGFLAHDQQRLQLLRVLQEAFANVLKHAQASTVQLSTEVFNDRIVVELRDDGVGIDLERAPTAQPLGHGLASMHLRAQDMGATLKLSRLEPGTSVRLTFPWSTG